MQTPLVEVRNTAIVPDLHPDRPLQYNSVNYFDDIAGCESDPDKASRSYQSLGSLMTDLGLVESTAKACAPSTRMVFFGIHFDTDKMILANG
jgi:hypothetical protein